HVLRKNTFRGLFIVGAAGSVDVMIPGVPTKFGGINPALEPEGDFERLRFNLEGLMLVNIFGTARVFDDVFTRGKQDAFTIGTIDLRMKEEVRSEALGLRGIDALEFVPDEE